MTSQRVATPDFSTGRQGALGRALQGRGQPRGESAVPEEVLLTRLNVFRPAAHSWGDLVWPVHQRPAGSLGSRAVGHPSASHWAKPATRPSPESAGQGPAAALAKSVDGGSQLSAAHLPQGACDFFLPPRSLRSFPAKLSPGMVSVPRL